MAGGSDHSSIALRGYQREALTAIEEAAARGVRRQLVVLPTGTGKTVVFAEWIRRRGGRALILVHRDELVRQAVEKLAVIAPRTRVGVVKAERDEHGADVIVASVQTLTRPARLDRLRLDFGLVVIDEAHHLAAESYQRVLEHLGLSRANGPLALGVTATPERADGHPLEGWDVVYRRELLEMIEQRYCCDLRALQVRLEADFSQLHVRAGDFVDSEVEALMLDANAPHHAVAAYEQHAAGRTTLAFTPTVRLAHEMAKAFTEAGIAAEALDGGMPLELRREILARFRRDAIRVLANCAVLTEGFDEPAINCVILGRPTRSRLLYMQMLGRGTRLHPGKVDCLLVDLVGATTRHDLLTAAIVLRLPEPTLRDRGAAAAVEARRAEQAGRAAHGCLVAETVELFRRRRLHWVAAGPGRFVLTIGSGMLVLEPTTEPRWRVLLQERSAVRVVADGLPLHYAQGVAEDWARKAGAGALVDPNAAWRSEPATEKQRAALRRCRIGLASTLTRGEASDLLARAFVGIRG
jgi:ATP-dependent helicase IRC3